LLLIPVLMFSFAKAIFNIRKAFKSFLPTPHTGSPDRRVP
jgi:1,2-diacylglycerol 3-beta-glucosyltransferase